MQWYLKKVVRWEALAGDVLHSFVSQRYGVRVRSITLLPLGGIAALEDVPEPRQEVPIALAGPAVNLVIAGVVLGFLVVSRSDRSFLHPIINTEDLWPSLLWANLYVALFNLIPAYPMDGGRILRGWLARKTDYVPEHRAQRCLAHRTRPTRARFLARQLSRCRLPRREAENWW